jgi:hypothetical protein
MAPARRVTVRLWKVAVTGLGPKVLAAIVAMAAHTGGWVVDASTISWMAPAASGLRATGAQRRALLPSVEDDTTAATRVT